MLFGRVVILAAGPALVLARPLPMTTFHEIRAVASQLLSTLFPSGSGSALFTTAQDLDNAVPLTFKGLKPVNGPDPKAPAVFKNNTLQINFKKGSFRYQKPGSGANIYATPIDLSNAKEVTMSYSLQFDPGFDFNKGGKLPGIYGGSDPKSAQSCSGGSRSTDCHSVRFMWRTDGKGELYTYLPEPELDQAFVANKVLCKPPLPGTESHCNDKFGVSVGRGAIKFEPGKTHTIGVRAQLNDVGKSNGELELFFEGKSTFNVTGLAFRNQDKHKFQGLMMQSFFGGNDASWASPQDQSILTKDYSLAVTKTF